MVSLLKLAEITEVSSTHFWNLCLKLHKISLCPFLQGGVKFQSPHDNSEMLLTPEHSIEIQNTIGADIIMQLDDVVHVKTTGPRVEEAMWRSVRWLDRCIQVHGRKDSQNLFGIIQGGLQPELRRKCVKGKYFNCSIAWWIVYVIIYKPHLHVSLPPCM